MKKRFEKGRAGSSPARPYIQDSLFGKKGSSGLSAADAQQGSGGG
jgi:hypothetical protein